MEGEDEVKHFDQWFNDYATDGSDRILHENTKVNTALRDAFQAGERYGKGFIEFTHIRKCQGCNVASPTMQDCYGCIIQYYEGHKQ